MKCCESQWYNFSHNNVLILTLRLIWWNAAEQETRRSSTSSWILYVPVENLLYRLISHSRITMIFYIEKKKCNHQPNTAGNYNVFNTICLTTLDFSRNSDSITPATSYFIKYRCCGSAALLCIIAYRNTTIVNSIIRPEQFYTVVRNCSGILNRCTI